MGKEKAPIPTREELLATRVQVRNKQDLAVTPLRTIVLDALEEGLSAVLPERALARSFKIDEGGALLIDGAFVADVSRWKRFVFVAVGKCAYRAVLAFDALVSHRKPDVGIVLGVGQAPRLMPDWARVFEGTHPFPSEANMAAARALLEALEGLGEDDGVIAVVSGGASVLLCGSAAHVCLAESRLTQALFAGGATIQELNTVRKHLSPLRGGGLARAAYPAEVVALVMSDVPGDDVGTIASGPFVRDETTVEDAWQVLERYGATKLEGVERSLLTETPKDPSLFARVSHFIIASNVHALDAMQQVLMQHRITAEVCDRCLAGEARVVGRNLVRALRSDMPPRSARLYGGETTVTIRGKGKGGRNQEVALAALVEGIPPQGLVVACASDGWDNGPHAGAIADQETLTHAALRGLSPSAALEDNDSASFFEDTGDAIITGPTGANVADLLLVIHG